MTIFETMVDRRIACEDEKEGWGYPQSEACYDGIEEYQSGQEDLLAHSDVEGRTAQRRSYRRLSSSGYRNTLSELLRGRYSPYKSGDETVSA